MRTFDQREINIILVKLCFLKSAFTEDLIFQPKKKKSECFYFLWVKTEFWTQNYLSLNNYEMPEVTWCNVVQEIEKLLIYECQMDLRCVIYCYMVSS